MSECSMKACALALAISAGALFGPARGNPPIAALEARPQVMWQEAASAIGRHAAVYGKIARIGHARTIHFLNFDSERRDVFKVVVFEEYMDRFPKSLEDLYLDKLVRVEGIVTEFGGAPQIAVTNPSQITLLDELPKLPSATKVPATSASTARAEITIATFNVRNLFDDVDDPYRADETTPAKPRKELEQLAATIRRVNADVLALQEVESRDYLQRFLDVMLPDSGYEQVVHFEGNDLRGIDVCLISRVPIGPVVSHRHLRFPGADGASATFERDVLAATIEPNGGKPFELWVLHLKSNSDGREHAEPIRLSECKQVRALLDRRLEQDPNARIVVCGDFNDTAESATLQTIVGAGETALRGDWGSIPETERVTYLLEPHRSMIDFILWSPAMSSAFVAGSYRVEPGTAERLGSDHAPVIARFRVDYGESGK